MNPSARSKYMQGLKPANNITQTRKKNKTIEHNLQTAIIQKLLYDNFVVIRLNSGAVKTETSFARFYMIENLKLSSGLADLLIMKNGKVWFIEVKADEKKKLSENQKEVCEYFNSVGIPYFKVGSFDEFEIIFKELKRRTIKFRGKRVDNGEWVEGLPVYNIDNQLCIQKPVHKIVDGFAQSYLQFPIIPETLGQFTGLQDKDGWIFMKMI